MRAREIQWANRCDFLTQNQNIAKEYVKSDDCANACKKTVGCTHFRWFDGECLQNWGLITKSHAFWDGKRTGICGILNLPTKLNSGI